MVPAGHAGFQAARLVSGGTSGVDRSFAHAHRREGGEAPEEAVRLVLEILRTLRRWRDPPLGREGTGRAAQLVGGPERPAQLATASPGGRSGRGVGDDAPQAAEGAAELGDTALRASRARRSREDALEILDAA